MTERRFRVPPWPILLLAFVFAFGAAFTLWGPVNLLAWRGGDFPETPEDRPAYQQRLVDLAREQYEAQPGPRRYTPDPEGPWDAAFVSWLFNEAGLPVRYPHADDPEAWRVDDVLELRDVLADRGAYIPVEEEPDLMPQIGDLIFYDYPGPLGHHVNMVVAVYDDVITVGGDELGGVGLASMNLRNRGGIMGWGATGRLEDPLAPTEAAAPEDDASADDPGLLPDDAEPNPGIGPEPAPRPEDAPR